MACRHSYSCATLTAPSRRYDLYPPKKQSRWTNHPSWLRGSFTVTSACVLIRSVIGLLNCAKQNIYHEYISLNSISPLGVIGGGMRHTSMVAHVLHVHLVLEEAVEKIFVIKVCIQQIKLYLLPLFLVSKGKGRDHLIPWEFYVLVKGLFVFFTPHEVTLMVRKT